MYPFFKHAASVNCNIMGKSVLIVSYDRPLQGTVDFGFYGVVGLREGLEK